MTALLKNKGILLTVLLLATAITVYNFFFKPSMVQTSSDAVMSQVGAEVLDLRSKLQSATLDKSFFASPAFLYLTDFSVSVPMQTIGRRNPFEEIGR